jgi:hypothetical protein
MITGMAMYLADAFIDAIEADGGLGADVRGTNIQGVLAAYFQAFERILGAPTGSLASWARQFASAEGDRQQ